MQDCKSRSCPCEMDRKKTDVNGTKLVDDQF